MATDLTSLEDALVNHLVEKGGSVRAAARAIGASHSACISALRRARVRDALEEGLRGVAMALGAEALRKKATLMRSAKSETVRSQSASDLLDRAVPRQVTERREVLGDVKISIDLNPLAPKGHGPEQLAKGHVLEAQPVASLPEPTGTVAENSGD